MKLKMLFVATALILAACAKDVSQVGTVPADQNSQTAVFGGEKVETEEAIARTTVGLYNSSVGYLCTGSLYGQDMVITAAHCLVGAPSDLKVIFGLDMRNALEVRSVVAGQKHPRYTGKITADMGDIALLKYKGTIPESLGFKPVDFLGNYKVLNQGAEIIAAGYGIKGATLGTGAGILRKVDLDILNPAYSSTEISVKQSAFKGVCRGDSGGPAFFKGSDGKLYLWGITSNGAGIPKLRACMFFSVFTRVDRYADWIMETAQSL